MGLFRKEKFKDMTQQPATMPVPVQYPQPQAMPVNQTKDTKNFKIIKIELTGYGKVWTTMEGDIAMGEVGKTVELD